MKKFLVFILCYLVTLPAFSQNTILIVGDSISAGYGIDAQKGWTNQLRERLKQNHSDYQVINASISGDTTSNGLSRLPKLLEQHHPNITIIELGGNDGLRGIPLAAIKKNLSQMIQKSLAAKSKVLILGVRLPPNYGPEYIEQFQDMFVELASEYKISVVPLFLKGIDENDKMMQQDRIHPTAEAQMILLDNVWPELQTLFSN